MVENKGDRVFIWDETLRDGEQSPGVALSVEEKVEIARLLDEIGVKVVDAGFPVVSESEREAIKAIVKDGLSADVGVTIRAKKEDIDSALSCDVKEVHMFLPTSDIHLEHKLRIKREEAIVRLIDAVDYAASHSLIIDFIAEDTSRTDMGFLKELLTPIVKKIDKFMITDTVGVMTPDKMSILVEKVKEIIPGMKLGVHCHNDFGLATANTIAAIEAGVRYPTVTVNGIGERAGNASFEEVVAASEFLLNKDTGIKTERLKGLSELVEEKTGMFVAANKPIVGFNAFRHESGIHVDGLLKNLETYEVLRPDSVGAEREFVLGKHSGRGLIVKMLSERAIELDDDRINEICEAVKKHKEGCGSFDMRQNIHDYHRSYLGFDEAKFWELVESIR